MWTKIGFGAVGVFLLGMLLLIGFRRSKAVVAQAVAQSLVPALHAAASYGTGAQAELPFRLEGNRLGTVTRMQIERTDHNRLMSVKLVVHLDDRAAPAGLEACHLLPMDDNDLGFDHGFRCGTATEPGLVQIGEIRFEPVGFARPLKVRRAQLDQLSTGDPFQADIDLTHGLQVDARGRDKGSVRVQADSAGAVMRVRDGNGGELVRIAADSTQAFIQIRDKNGKEVFRLRADKAGISMTVDTNTEPP
jgi:hypothetical protein